jgi:site-specific recombinase XerD
LLWAVFERKKALSDLDHVDCLEYRRFLGDIGPGWLGRKSVPRWSEHWRPFEGPLGPRSKKAAEAVVTTMCAWLTEVRYLDFNPWTQVPRVNRPTPLQELRSLSDRQWTLVAAWLAAQPDTAANDRLRMMFSLALATGMREAELAGARAGWLRQDTDEEGELAWNLVVLGKGAKEREVPLTAKVALQLAAHLDRKGLGTDLGAIAPELPLLSGLTDATRPLQPERIYELMKAALVACAASVEDSDPKSAQRIRQASPHWLRHTHGRKFVEAGGDRGVLRQNLGHASDATTAIYDRSGARHRRREVEKVFG